MASAFEITATAVKAIFELEFAAEGFKMRFDKIHESLGWERVEVGIHPLDEVVRPGNALIQEMRVEVRFYGLWTKEIDPHTVINPVKVTNYAERFRSALGRSHATDPATDEVWYFDVLRVDYPDDPTGNKSRFHATIRAWGNNSGLIETAA